MSKKIPDIWLKPNKYTECYWDLLINLKLEYERKTGMCLLRRVDDRKWYLSHTNDLEGKDDIGPYENLCVAKKAAYYLLRLKGLINEV